MASWCFIQIFIFYFVMIFSNFDLLCYRIVNHLQRMPVIRECTIIHMNIHKSFFRKKQVLIKRYLAKLALKFHFERGHHDKKSKNMSITCRLLLFLILSASRCLIKWWWNTIKHYWNYYWALLNWNVTCNSDCKFEYNVPVEKRTRIMVEKLNCVVVSACIVLS